MHLFYAALTFSLLLLGCTTKTAAVNADPAKNNSISFKQDLTECRQAYPDAASGVETKQRLACMRLKGWN